MIRNPWYKLLTNNYRYSVSHGDYRRAYLLNTVLITLFGISLYFLVANALLFKPSVIIVNAAAALCALGTLVFFHKTDNIRMGTYAAVFVLFGALAAFLEVSEHRHYALFWICTFPPTVYFLLGRTKGRIATGVFSAYLLFFLLTKYKSWGSTEFTLESIANIVGASFALVLLISYFELSRKEAATGLEQKNKELEDINNALKENKDQLRLILDSTAEAIYGIDLEGRCIFCNANCIKMLGYERQEELLGNNMHFKIHHTHKDGTLFPIEECGIFQALHEKKGTYINDEVFWRCNGTSFETEYHSYPQFKNGEVVGAVITFLDITVRKKEEAQIKFLSSHDALTGLFNRGRFEEALRKTDIAKNLPISIIFADINGLKLTNDVYGHVAGDELIKKTAEIIKSACRDRDIVARVGGDEFIIILPNTKAEGAEKVIARIKSELSKEKINAVKCNLALGFDTKTISEEDIAKTMGNAECEMYKEKTMNRKALNLDMIDTILTTLHDRAPREKQHSANVSELCRKLGQALKLGETDVKRVKDAGFFHDIGKIVLDDTILKKEDMFTEEEQKELQQHSIVGYRILNLFDDTLDLAEAVYCHHERWDGLGYPKGMKGEEIPKMARIISIAEAYDDLANNKIKDASSKEAALEEIKSQAGTKFDPAIVEIFADMITESRQA